MKIALLTEKYTPDIGGLAISSERLARLLTSAEHNVRVFAPTLNLPPSEKRIINSNGISLLRFGAHKRVDDTLVDWFELIKKEHKRESFDVLHGYFLTQAGFVTTYAGKYLSIPSIVSIRGNDIERAAFDPSKFSHTMYALQNADAVTTNATELVRKAKAFVDREIVLIPNGIDSENFKPLANLEKFRDTLKYLPPLTTDEKSWTQSKSTSPFQSRIQNPIIGFVGELREKKGLKTLLTAYSEVNKQKPTSLMIVGVVRDGEDRKYFKDHFEAHPNDRIFVTGMISHNGLPAYYSTIDVFVHPSLRDGMPNAVMEAMACERAIIATGVGGVADVIKDRENGIIVPVNDAESLSKSILELLNDASLRKQLGQSARETILNNFTPEKELLANLAVYKNLGVSL